MEKTTAAQWRPPPWFLLEPPLPKPGTLRRPRIHELLESSVEAAPITLVQAPAGFGKSTALADWVQQLRYPVAWLSATGGDKSPAQFAVGLLGSLRRVAEESSELTAILDVVASPDDLRLMLGRILGALRGAEQPIVAVIDDAQELSAEVARDVIGPLAEHAPKLRYVLAGTLGLDGWFGDQLVAGTGRLIGPDALAMTRAEIGALAPADFRTEEADLVQENTRGWPVAVRLALAARTDGATPEVLSADDLIANYISESLLRALPPDLADFVLAATTASRLTPGLAEHLTGRQDAGALLEECVRQGLFLDRYRGRDESSIYRWHDVFAGHCRVLLARLDEPRQRRLNRRTAEALAPHFPVKASVHAMRARDPQLAWDILRGSWLRLLAEGEAAVLNARCLALPSQMQGPEVLLIRASCLSSLGDEAGAEQLMTRARTALRLQPDRDPGLRFAAAFAGLFLAHDHAELANAADEVAEVLRRPGPSGYLDTHAQFLLGWTELRLRRDPGTAVRLLGAARRDAEAVGADLLARRAGLNLMFAYALGGEFNAAQTLGDQLDAAAALSPDRWEHYDGGIEFVARGMTAYWRNELPEAERNQRTIIAQGGGPSGYVALARVHFALTAAATGDARLIAEASSHLGGISDVEQHGVAWPAYRAIAAAALAAASGERARALALCEPLLSVETIPMTRILVAELLRKGGRPELALDALRGIGRLERVSYINVSALVTTAAIMSDRGDRDQAHRLLERALDIACEEGIELPFVTESGDNALRDLLTEHAAWGSAHEAFLAKLIAHSEYGMSREDVLGDALSPREREIFGYLCTTMTADEIAGALFVSVNTVRTHQRAIYRKLGVGSRREAIRRYRT